MNVSRYFFPLFCILFMVLISRPVLGNGTVEPEWYEAPLTILFLIFIIGPLIESLIVLGFLKKKEKLKIYLLLFIYFLIINFLTLGPTQLLVVLLADEFRTNLFVIGELFPITVEFFALLSFFSYYKRKKDLKNEYSKKYLFLMVLISNLITIILGVILFFAVP